MLESRLELKMTIDSKISKSDVSRGVLTVAELGVVDYDDALSLQTEMLAKRIEGWSGYVADDGTSACVYAWAWADERFIVGDRNDVPVRRVFARRAGDVSRAGAIDLLSDS